MSELYKYKAIFIYGEETEVEAYSRTDAILKATIWAIDKGINRTIKEMYDDKNRLLHKEDLVIKFAQ